jgi:drug/metabolite transporter (DMT)-like permease
MLPIITSIVGCFIANTIYAMAAYDPEFKTNPWKGYGLPMLVAMLSTAAWMWLIRSIDSDRQTFWINMAWDVGATLICIIMPVFLYGVKVDTRTAIGCAISIIGLMIVKTSEGR